MPELDLLGISGGGENGAFGAGLLNGWTERGGRPTFFLVTGISTGALSLDIALGGRGLPRGRIIEIFGPEASGKTTVMLHAIAQAQKTGGVAAFIDAEHALDPGWAKKVGVNLTAYIRDRLSGQYALPSLASLIARQSVPAAQPCVA